MSRILWIGNPPWTGSGYGEQAGLFLPRFQQMGHQVAVACNHGLQGATFDWHGTTCYPADGAWGNQTIRTYSDHFQADLTIALCDAWVLQPQDWPEGTRAAVWAPIDHYPIPPRVLATLQHERITPIAMSRFGEHWMRRFDLDPLYVPHGVDTAVFYPRPDDRDAIRDELDIPRDAYLVGMVAANSGNPAVPRKAFPQAFDAFATFANRHPDAWLYAHSKAHPTGGSGISLDKLATAVGCPTGRVRFPPDEAWQLGMTSKVVSNIYQAFDVLLMPSMGEGFGVPLLEAQACGVPVIASNHSAMSELATEGWLVEGDRWWDALQDSFFIVPSVASIVSALEAAYAARADDHVRIRAAEFALAYDADTVSQTYWEPALAKLLEPRSVPPLNGVKLNRKQRRRLAKVGA